MNMSRKCNSDQFRTMKKTQLVPPCAFAMLRSKDVWSSADASKALEKGHLWICVAVDSHLQKRLLWKPGTCPKVSWTSVASTVAASTVAPPYLNSSHSSQLGQFDEVSKEVSKEVQASTILNLQFATCRATCSFLLLSAFLLCLCYLLSRTKRQAVETQWRPWTCAGQDLLGRKSEGRAWTSTLKSTNHIKSLQFFLSNDWM